MLLNNPLQYLRRAGVVKDLDFDGAISLELEYAPDPSKIVEWVTEAYNSTDKLMAEVNLRN